MSNKFCYLFGSMNEFYQRTGKLPTPNKNQNINMMCSSNITQEDIRKIMKEAFPKEHEDKVNITYIHVEKDTLYPHVCYWQKCNFLELLNTNKIHYKFNCHDAYIKKDNNLNQKLGLNLIQVKNTNINDFGAHLRDPNKFSLFTYFGMDLNSKTILDKHVIENISTNMNYNRIIEKHYGHTNFLNVLRELNDAEFILIDSLKTANWRITPKCQGLFGAFYSISTKDKRVISKINPDGMTYSEFMKHCVDYSKEVRYNM